MGDIAQQPRHDKGVRLILLLGGQSAGCNDLSDTAVIDFIGSRQERRIDARQFMHAADALSLVPAQAFRLLRRQDELKMPDLADLQVACFRRRQPGEDLFAMWTVAQGAEKVVDEFCQVRRQFRLNGRENPCRLRVTGLRVLRGLIARVKRRRIFHLVSLARRSWHDAPHMSR